MEFQREAEIPTFYRVCSTNFSPTPRLGLLEDLRHSELRVLGGRDVNPGEGRERLQWVPGLLLSQGIVEFQELLPQGGFCLLPHLEHGWGHL